MTYATLISAEELRPHLEDPAWLIVDCQFDLDDPEGGRAAYLQGHIPGAVHADLERDLSAPLTGSNGRHPLPSVDDLVEFLSHLGVAEGMQVVAYDDFGGAFAARLWWTLRYLGHDLVAVLDGGLTAWTSGGLPLSSGAETRTAATFHASPRQAMLIHAEDVLHASEDPALLLLDARSSERFRGIGETRDPIAGRIPGARNRPWQDSLTDQDRFRSSEQLKSELRIALAGIPPENVIVYCGSGVTACHDLLAMEHVGMGGARLYAGSWSEWIADPSRPIAVGEPDEGER